VVERSAAASEAAGSIDAPPPGHPGPAEIVVHEVLREALIEHARREYPNEACGIVVGDLYAADGGVALRFAATRNEAASPLRYRIDAADLLRLTIETDDEDEVFWAIFHSHVRSPAVPSPTDVNAAQYRDALYILVSLADSEADPVSGDLSVRAWRIVDGATHEVAIRREP
jgi:[CysO sulfur-carrier protein]-S-L-cysteine hydrolase